MMIKDPGDGVEGNARAQSGNRGRPLLFSDNVQISKELTVKRLDLDDANVLHDILITIQREERENTTMGKTRYNNKNSKRWFDVIYPPSLDPVFLGAFIPDDMMIGWISLYRSMVIKGRVIVGAIIEPDYRDKGLCSALYQHMQKYIGEIYPEHENTELFFRTAKDNTCVHHIAKKFSMNPLSLRDEYEPRARFYSIKIG
ncbi:MAG: GNAT family N-acetyltransferase [Promethearchaeota archaeon]